MQTPGAPSSPYGERAAAEAGVVRLVRAGRQLLAAGRSARHAHPQRPLVRGPLWRHPRHRPSEHRLLVHGLVERPTLFRVDDLKRFPAVSVVHFLECSDNSFPEWTEAPR